MADVPEEETPKETAEAKPKRQVKRSPEGSNRNSLRSLHLLEQSYLSLIMKKPSDKITVADITREAGLNRGTFYAHFSSVSELEAYVLQELVDRFMSIGTSWFDISFVQDPEPLLKKVGAFVEEHRELIQTKQQVDDELKRIKADILLRMEATNAKIWETDSMRITRKLPTQRESFDLGRYKADNPDLDLSDYMKVSNVSGSVLITI